MQVEPVDPVKVTYAVMGATGNVGRHVLKELLRLTEGDSGDKVVEFTRHACSTVDSSSTRASSDMDQDKGTDTRVIRCFADLSQTETLTAALRAYCVQVLFVCMPQALSSGEMKACAQALGAALSQSPGIRVVRLSSCNIEPSTTRAAGAAEGQGALGDAHLHAERALLEAGVHLVSVRPVSFFSNFDLYDLPALLDGSLSIASPLGHAATARVNWIACEDIGAVVAHLMLRCHKEGDKALFGCCGGGGERHLKVTVTGGCANTLSLCEYRSLLSTACRDVFGTEAAVYCTDLPLPEASDYGDLWRFLRAGGFDTCTTAVKDITGRDPMSLLDHVKRKLREGKSASASASAKV
jgi:hypothetical protein